MKEVEFNLLEEPWIRVLCPDCTVQEVSLTQALLHAHGERFALRLCLVGQSDQFEDFAHFALIGNALEHPAVLDIFLHRE